MSIVVKCIGAGAIIGGAYILGNCFNKELREKERFDSGLEQGLRFLEGRIAITEKMLSDVMKEAGDKFFGGEKNVFNDFSKGLLKGGEASETWRGAVEKMTYPGGGVPERERECLLKLEHAFTLSDVERYSENFIAAAEEMKGIRLEVEAKRKKEGSAAIKICLCGALAAVLVIW